MRRKALAADAAKANAGAAAAADALRAAAAATTRKAKADAASIQAWLSDAEARRDDMRAQLRNAQRARELELAARARAAAGTSSGAEVAELAAQVRRRVAALDGIVSELQVKGARGVAAAGAGASSLVTNHARADGPVDIAGASVVFDTAPTNVLRAPGGAGN